MFAAAPKRFLFIHLPTTVDYTASSLLFPQQRCFQVLPLISTQLLCHVILLFVYLYACPPVFAFVSSLPSTILLSPCRLSTCLTTAKMYYAIRPNHPSLRQHCVNTFAFIQRSNKITYTSCFTCSHTH